MDTRLFRGLTPKEKNAIISLLKSHKEGLEQFADLLENIKQDKRKPPDYNNPAWAYEQAHRNGFEEAVDTIQRIARSIK